MTWFKVDDNLSFHQKVIQAGNAAMGLWVRTGSWCAQHLTDGYVPNHMISQLGTRGQARALVNAGLWIEVDGGYLFHEWGERQPTRAAKEAEREAKRKAGESGGRASGRRRSEASTYRVTSLAQSPSQTEAETQAHTKQSASPNGSRDPSTHEAVCFASGSELLNPRPVPSRSGPTDPPPDSEPNGSSSAPNTEAHTKQTASTEGTVVPMKPQVTARDLIAEWLECRAERPPERFIGQVSKGVKQLLDEGIDPRRVRDGLATWHRKNLGPSALPSVVAEVMNRSNGVGHRSGSRLPTADQRAVDGAALEAKLRAEESS